MEAEPGSGGVCSELRSQPPRGRPTLERAPFDDTVAGRRREDDPGGLRPPAATELLAEEADEEIDQSQRDDDPEQARQLHRSPLLPTRRPRGALTSARDRSSG